MIKALAHVCILANDLEKTLWFYCKVLGLEKMFEFLDGDRLIGYYLKINESNFIEVFESKSNLGEHPARIKHFCLEVDSVKNTYDLLKQHEIEVSEPLLGKDQAWQVWCKDPNGVSMEFHEYTAFSLQRVGGVCR